jgi:electron transfer flavoprotein-quinone oxidoreductase
MQAQGPIIKGMNHAVTAGALAAEAYLESKSRREEDMVGHFYKEKLQTEGVMDKLRPARYEFASKFGENETISNVVDSVVTSGVGRMAVRAFGGTFERLYSSPFLVGMIPDTRTPYVTLPTVIAEELGTPVRERNDVQPPDLADRIGDLTYDVDIGNPHIELQDKSFAASGTAVTACPVSATDFGGGCYRAETVETNGGTEKVVSLDTQPCVECGTCAVVADTTWEHPRGGKGVDYQQG